MKGMSAAIQLHELKIAEDVWNKINHSTFPKTRCTLKIIKIILLRHDTAFNLFNGEQVIFNKRSLGAGVYEVWMEVKKR